MTLTDYIRDVRTSAKQLADAARYLSEFCDQARDLWPDHQIRPAQWEPRSQTPPAGWVWASDGLRVWLIHCDGRPIPTAVALVRFWTLAYIPAPPRGAAPAIEAEAVEGEGGRLRR